MLRNNKSHVFIATTFIQSFKYHVTSKPDPKAIENYTGEIYARNWIFMELKVKWICYPIPFFLSLIFIVVLILRNEDDMIVEREWNKIEQ